MSYVKPDIVAEYPIDAPDDSDFFEDSDLGLQWQWNANYQKSWYELGGGCLKLYAIPSDDRCLYDMSNLLLQKWPAPEFSATARLHLDELKDGDSCGMVSLGGCCDSLLICRKDGENMLCQRTGEVKKNEDINTDLGRFDGDVLYIRMKVEGARSVSWEISVDGKEYRAVGSSTQAVAGAWVGVKVGLVAYNEGGVECGAAKADFFRFEPLSDRKEKS